jgi:hypothetical protein
MFDNLNTMTDFITLAPWFIFGGFGATFLLTFATIKLAQSDTVYDWVAGKMDAWRASQAAKIRRTITRDAIEFRGNRKVEELSDVEQKLYFKILESGYERVGRLYKTEGGK